MGNLRPACAALAVVFILQSAALAGEDVAHSDPAKAIEARQCCQFAISLESNRTTGFGWDIAEPLDECVVRFLSCEYVPADTSVVGSGGREIWTFQAVCPGRANISFKYVRPWEKDVPPARKTVFSVVVR